MAVMNKMREKMTVIFAGLAGAFLLMIIFEWGAQGDFFKGNQRKPDEIGKVNGSSVTNKDYDEAFNQMRQQKLQETKKTTLTDAEDAEIREKAWEQVIVTKLIAQKIDEFGIVVTDQEVRDVMFYNPPEFLKRNFIDSATGRFDENAYFTALRDPHNDTTVANISKQMREELKKQKLSNYLQAGMRVTRADMWERYENTNAKATVEMIKLKPTKNPRELMSKVSDDDVKKYYEEHSFNYKREESRKIKFAMFREVPTPKDSVLLLERIEGLKKKWAALPVTSSDSVVSDLARDYTDAGYQPAQDGNPSTFNTFSNGDDLINSKVGDIVVLSSGGQVKVTRILSEQDTGSTYYHAKGIMIGLGRPENKDSAKALATKLYNDIKAGGDFAAIARQYSMDPSARNGGDMHWMKQKMYVPEVEDAAIKSPIGTLEGPIESKIGYHIFQVLGRTNRTFKIGTIPIDIKASSQTAKMLQQQANIFREKAVKDGFDKAAQAQGVRVISDGPPIAKKGESPMFGYAPWVNYVFDLSTGDITDPVKIPNAKIIVVGQLTEILPEGVRPLDSLLKEQIKNILVKRKAVEDLAGRAKQLRDMLSPGDDLSKLSASDSTLKPSIVSMGPAESVAGLGTEYTVNNAAYAMKVGEISQPIQGEAGYYIIKLLAMKPADKNQFEAQQTKEFESLSQEKQQRFLGQWIQQLKEKAKVIDYRSHRM